MLFLHCATVHLMFLFFFISFISAEPFFKLNKMKFVPEQYYYARSAVVYTHGKIFSSILLYHKFLHLSNPEFLSFMLDFSGKWEIFALFRP